MGLYHLAGATCKATTSVLLSLWDIDQGARAGAQGSGVTSLTTAHQQSEHVAPSTAPGHQRAVLLLYIQHAHHCCAAGLGSGTTPHQAVACTVLVVKDADALPYPC